MAQMTGRLTTPHNGINTQLRKFQTIRDIIGDQGIYQTTKTEIGQPTTVNSKRQVQERRDNPI